MFAHSLGLGLFEDKKLNWFDNKGWERLGYKVQESRDKNSIRLSRYPIHRFDGLDIESSVVVYNDTNISRVCNILKKLRDDNSDLKPDDIAIIIIDDNKNSYTYIDRMCFSINRELGWSAVRGYESKQTIQNHIYVTNPNNVKGLEFPYVICITSKILDTYRYRNTIIQC